MSVGPLGMASGFAGAAQSRGSDVERSQQDDTVQQRKVNADQKAESASGVGETAEDQEASDRDADGRRLFEPQQPESEGDESPSQEPNASDPAPSKDASGDRGTHLDLSG